MSHPLCYTRLMNIKKDNEHTYELWFLGDMVG